MSDAAAMEAALDAATREREYSPSSCIGGNYQPYIAAYAERSAAARQAFLKPASGGAPGRWWPDLAYGPSPRERIDLFVPPARSGALPPVLVFIHGGYWQELSKNESQFAAVAAVEQGVALAVVDYTLAPEASLPQITAQCRIALQWLHREAPRLGVDGNRLVVAGSSAGAHLAAMCALPDAGLPGIAGAVLVSGVYELEPLVGTSINDALGLDAATARRMSPALAAVQGFPPSVVAWGDIETREFKRQSLDFAQRLALAGTPCQLLQIAGRNHFDVVFDLIEGPGALAQSTRRLLTPA